MVPKLLVIIVTYNAMRWIERCIASVIKSDLKADIIVIDNGSVDGTQDYIKSFADIRFIQSSTNLGFGAANNIGINYAVKENYDYIYLLNQDAWVYPNTFETLISCHKNNPEYGILSPFQIQANTVHLDQNFLKGVCSSNIHITDDFYFGRINDVYDVQFVMAAHWLVSRECFSIVGAFSPTFSHYGEDDNYCHRAIYHGFKVGICPKAKAVHDREDRVLSVEKQAYLLYTSCLSIMSDINRSVRLKSIFPLRFLIQGSRGLKSFIPCKYLLRVYMAFHTIKRNNNISKLNGAFLNV
jgi:GT2 family glycosyltransferase